MALPTKSFNLKKKVRSKENESLNVNTSEQRREKVWGGASEYPKGKELSR